MRLYTILIEAMNKKTLEIDFKMLATVMIITVLKG